MQELILVTILLFLAGFAIFAALLIVFSGIKAATGPMLGAAIVLGLYFAEAVLLALPPVSLGLLIYPQDLVFVGLFLIGVIRGLMQSHASRLQIVLLLIITVDLALFAAGTFKFGTNAGVELRPFFYLSAGTLYFSSFKYDEHALHNLERLLIVVVTCFLLLAAYRWAADIVGFGGVNWGQRVGARAMRVLNSSHALFLLAALFVLAHGLDQSVSRFRAVFLASVLIAIIVLQHRTVWIALLIGMALMLRLRPSYFRWTSSPITVFLVMPAALMAVITVLIASPTLTDSLVLSVTEAFQSKRSTFMWRVSGWQELISDWLAGGPVVNVFGFPYGKGWRHYVPDISQFADYSPHSFYVQTLLRGGLIKLALVGTLFGATAIALLQRYRDGTGEARAALFTAVVLAIATYLITYGTDYFMGVMLGIALSLAAARGNVPLRSPSVYISGMQPT